MATAIQRIRSQERSSKIHQEVLAEIKKGRDPFEVLEERTADELRRLTSWHLLIGRGRKSDNLSCLLINVYGGINNA